MGDSEDKEPGKGSTGGKPAYGTLYVEARAYLNSLEKQSADPEAYARYQPLLVSWRVKSPTEWELFRAKTRNFPAGERRYIKLERATQFAEMRRSSQKTKITEATKMIRQAANNQKKLDENAAATEIQKVTTERRETLTLQILDFPPALKKGSPLGHDGRLSPNEIAHLRALGYDVQNYKQAIGPRQVELYLQGCTLGTIEFDENKFKSVEAMRKHYMRVTKQETEDELKHRKTADPVKLLAKWGALIGTEKFGGQRISMRTRKVKLTREEAELARLKHIADIIDKSAEDKIYEPAKWEDETVKRAAEMAQSMIKAEDISNLKRKIVGIVPAGEMAAEAAMKAEKE